MEKKVFKRVNAFIDSVGINSTDQSNRAFVPGEHFYILKHNSDSRENIPDALLLHNALNISEDSFFQAYRKKAFVQNIELKHYKKIVVDKIWKAKCITVVPVDKNGLCLF